jgi:hypothetical protein
MEQNERFHCKGVLSVDELSFPKRNSAKKIYDDMLVISVLPTPVKNRTFKHWRLRAFWETN